MLHIQEWLDTSLIYWNINETDTHTHTHTHTHTLSLSLSHTHTDSALHMSEINKIHLTPS